MTQRKEKTGICKSVIIATVVAIRGVVKNGFHCIEFSIEWSNSATAVKVVLKPPPHTVLNTGARGRIKIAIASAHIQAQVEVLILPARDAG